MNPQRPRPLESVDPDPAAELAPARATALVRQIPPGPGSVIAVLAALVIVDTVGIRVPGSGFARKVLSDPVVYFAIRTLVVAFLVGILIVVVWVMLSAAAHIKNRRWIRRIAGLEPQALHQGARQVEDGHEDVRAVADQLIDENMELTTRLELTTQLAHELRQENDRLRERLRERTSGQLQLEDDL